MPQYVLPTTEEAWQLAIDQFHYKFIRLSNGCWEWKQCSSRNGYGGACLFGKPDYAHRVSWILFNRRNIPKGMMVRHKCKVPYRRCVNPEHLELGTAKQNTADMMEQGRNKYIMPVVKYGSNHPGSKLVESDVREIRSLVASGTTKKAVADRFDITRSAVRKIVNGDTWVWLT